jgi:2-methylcitrate dehydratase PrpD
MYENVTKDLAIFITGVKYEDLPKDAVAKIKLILLDDIGNALGGYITDRARIAMELVDEMGGNPQASIIGGRLTSYAMASFINSELVNALDYDLIGPLGSHITPYVTSTPLAIAERECASGKDLILSLALSHEIGGRVLSSMAQQKMLIDEPPYYKESPRFSTSGTVFGAVAGAAKLLDFDVETLTNAFGIAGASTAVPGNIKWHHTTGPSIMSKYNCWTGWISQLATVSVLLAEKGFTGDRTILDGEYGYWQMVGSPYFKVENLLGGLGEVWHINEAKFKMYPTCAPYHTAIEGISNLINENQIRPDDIESIVVKGDPIMMTPNRRHTEIKSFADMQFAVLPNLALAVFYGGKPSPAWQMPGVYNDPRIKAMVPKIKLELHPGIDELIAEQAKAGKLPIYMGNIVEITAKGKKFTTEVVSPKGAAGRPVSQDELVEKFRVNASYSMLKSTKVEGLIGVLLRLDEVDDITELCGMMTIS